MFGHKKAARYWVIFPCFLDRLVFILEVCGRGEKAPSRRLLCWEITTLSEATIEEELVMLWAESLLLNVAFIRCWCVPYHIWKGTGGVGFWKYCRSTLRTHAVKLRCCSSPFLSFHVKSSGGFVPDCNLSRLPRTRSHFMCSQTQRVSLLVNLQCDKACNLIVALFPLSLPNIYSQCARGGHSTAVQSHPIPPWEEKDRLRLKDKSWVWSVRYIPGCSMRMCCLGLTDDEFMWQVGSVRADNENLNRCIALYFCCLSWTFSLCINYTLEGSWTHVYIADVFASLAAEMSSAPLCKY